VRRSEASPAGTQVLLDMAKSPPPKDSRIPMSLGAGGVQDLPRERPKRVLTLLEQDRASERQRDGDYGAYDPDLIEHRCWAPWYANSEAAERAAAVREGLVAPPPALKLPGYPVHPIELRTVQKSDAGRKARCGYWVRDIERLHKQWQWAHLPVCEFWGNVGVTLEGEALAHFHFTLGLVETATRCDEFGEPERGADGREVRLEDPTMLGVQVMREAFRVDIAAALEEWNSLRMREGRHCSLSTTGWTRLAGSPGWEGHTGARTSS